METNEQLATASESPKIESTTPAVSTTTTTVATAETATVVATSGTPSTKYRLLAQHFKLFDRPGDDELQRLHNLLKEQGTKVVIDFMPDDRIVSGAHYHEAMEKHGELPVTHRLRGDLEGRVNLGKLQREVLRDNLDRSDLPHAQRAYALTQLYLLEKSGPFRWDAPEVRTELGTKLTDVGFDAPEVDLLLQLAEAQEIVQRGVARGVLNMEAGVAIAKLGAEAQKKVAEAIKKPVDTFCARRAKTDLFQVKRQIETLLAEHIPIEVTPEGSDADPLGRFVASLKGAVSELDGQVKTLDKVRLAKELDNLKAGHKLIGALINRGERAK